MAAGKTYDALATQTLGSAAASVTFSSISGAYTDLVLVMSNIVTSINTSNVFFKCGNGSIDTGTNFSTTSLNGDGATARSSRQATQNKIIVGGWQAGTSNSSNYPSQVIVNIMNYANTTTNKTVLSRDAMANPTTGETAIMVGLWRSTSAIDIITLSPDSGNFSTGTFTLYGIKSSA